MPDILINLLPTSHPLRNLPLGTLKVFYKGPDTVFFRELFPSFGIAKKTYNELGEVWTKDTEWKTSSEYSHEINNEWERSQSSCSRKREMFLNEDWEEHRMDTIGSNGNEGLHYDLTDEEWDCISKGREGILC